ncbi:MAG TPA: methionine adenosyltransferase [Deinococcales bacterium]|nr:methionine adenosyltransferase [Deinococcales bacterium]
MPRLLTSESVTEGHPDKLADRISDSILDKILTGDPNARVAAETLVTTGLVLVAGEITTTQYVDIPATVRQAVLDVGYTRAKFGFDGSSCAVLNSINEQSPDIKEAVDDSWERRHGDLDPLSARGAGDQGLMFGYATDETPELMPLPILLAHRLTRQLAELRKQGTLEYLRPDGKAQVTVEYEDARPVALNTVVVSTQHGADVSQEEIRDDLIRLCIRPCLPDNLDVENVAYFINPSGRFEVGGPGADTGLTGRKIIVDTYGGAIPHGGGAFSGKDPSKVDRSAAYYARYIAKNVVAAGLAKRAMVEIAYAIGKARPVGFRVETFGTGRLADDALAALVNRRFDARPEAIIEQLDLRRGIYAATSAYGHFGRPEFPWEQTDMAARLS